MADLDKTIEGLREMSFRASWDDIDRERKSFQPIINNALELLKGYKKIEEQLEVLQIMEDLKVKECESYFDWGIYQYHRGRFDAYSIALAGFEQKDGEQE